MAKQPSCHKFIYKLPSKRLRQSGWKLTLPLKTAMKNRNDIVALNDSQLLRWICELNGIQNLDSAVSGIRNEIRAIRKQPESKENKGKIRELYEKLYSLQYQKDYFCMIMDSDQDYDRANRGFSINGYPYHRLLGTNGGIKKSTITYIGDNVYNEIVKRMDNGRDKSKPIIPAKLEAYQALICSGSIPVTMPRILIVKDCSVRFREDVIRISDDKDGEPELTVEKDYEVNYCDSDGYGFMSPDYSRTVNQDLYGADYAGQTISGINTRYAWTKGMLFTFDFVEFARQVNNGSYMVQDVWGQQRDVRSYDVILTASMVKLWDSYKSLEHFIACCNENHYQFSVSKAAPHELENVRNSNYQFLQTYHLTDEELYELCQPTIQEIRDVLGGDWRKTIVFAKGMYLNEASLDHLDNDFIKALMIDERMINDPYVIKKIYSMIKKRMEAAAKGSIQNAGNFAIISGDLYSLAQSIFGLPVTGLLKPGQVYHKYWIEKEVDEIVLFRAPMTCHNNIRRRKVVHNKEMDFWYQYNTTGLILNSWDTTCDALNGADKDSDTFFSTNNRILLAHTENSMTIECMQRKAPKIIPTQKDMVQANKLAFGDEIGTTTNRITAMIERQAGFAPDSEEYRVLDYRIKCGQHYQQCAIDRAKGILARPMPKYWYDRSACEGLPDDTEEKKHFKELCLRIVAENKPYFMKYVYPDLMTKYNKYIKDSNSKCIREFNISLADLTCKPDRSAAEEEFITYYKKRMPVGSNPCIVNRIAWLFEESFQGLKGSSRESDHPGKFDPSILKSGASYSKADYLKIEKLKKEYDESVKQYQQLANKQRLDKDEVTVSKSIMLLAFQAGCEEICPHELALCDIIVDLCYSSTGSRQFAWDMCGEIMIRNLLRKHDHLINYPLLVDTDGDFEFGGCRFIMQQKKLEENSTYDHFK